MKNKAVHKGNGLLPYPVIVSASQGDMDLCQYLGHKNSNLLKLHSKP